MFNNKSIVSALLLIAATANSSFAQIEVPTIQSDVVYGHKDGLALTFDVFQPVDPNGAGILFMVSGGWVSKWVQPELALPLFKPYFDAGYTVFAVRHGSSPRYTIPEAVADVRRATRYIRLYAKKFQVDANRLGVLGMSAGGHLSLMLGTTGDDGGSDLADAVARSSSHVAAVVALVPPTDLRVAIWSSPESLPAYRNYPGLNMDHATAEKYSPLVHVSADDAPSLVIMGQRDELVPPKHGHWIDEAFTEHGVDHKLIVLEGAGHGLDGPGNRERAFRESVEWFNTYLLEP